MTNSHSKSAEVGADGLKREPIKQAQYGTDAQPAPQQARWRCAKSRCKLEVFLPARNAHPDLHIVAINEFEPTHNAWAWQVHENGTLVAIGMHEDAAIAQRDCEQVICAGATPAQFAQAREFEKVTA